MSHLQELEELDLNTQKEDPVEIVPLEEAGSKSKVNFFFKKRVQVWVVADPDNELDLERVTPDFTVGQSRYSPDGHCDWFAYETSEGTIEVMIDMPREFDERLNWLAGLGIAPGQPFLLEIPMPKYTFDEWTREADTIYVNCRVIEIEPWTRAMVADAWSLCC